ncbi:MAG: hypothetical protein MUF53_04350 [Gemmatimonadaceae bacterium]|jgi:hypothetical protein|nr:hypothetical protein [Gemmatimonadaceae bacterium]
MRAFVAIPFLVVPPLAAQQVPAWATGTTRYKTTVTSEITQEAMGQSQSTTNTTYREATMVIAKATTGLDVSIRLDTTHLTSSTGGGGPSANLKGLTYKAATQPGGQPTTATVTDAAGAASTLPIAASLRAYLPRLKPGARRGESWVDTMAVQTDENGLAVTTTTETRFSYAGDTTLAGAKLLVIGLEASGKAKGAGDTPNGKASLEGTITTTGRAWITPAGQLVGVETTGSIARSVMLEDQGIAVTITQKQTLSTARLP